MRTHTVKEISLALESVDYDLFRESIMYDEDKYPSIVCSFVSTHEIVSKLQLKELAMHCYHTYPLTSTEEQWNYFFNSINLYPRDE